MKVLIITYYWPPSAGSGVQRWLYFAKYLGEFGINPIVLTVDPEKASYKTTDTTHLEDVSHIETHRTNTFELIRLFSKITSGNSNEGIPQGYVSGGKKNVFVEISKFIRGNFFVPDARIGWNKYALAQARKIIKHSRPDLVITTGPPHSTHLIGLRLQQEFGLKWMADFRDPWTEVFYNKIFHRTAWANAKDRKLESQVLVNADAILAIGRSLCQLLAQKVPNQGIKFHYVLNGYDMDVMRQVKFSPMSGFNCTFIGLLGESQPYKALIDGFGLALQNKPEIKADLKINFVGHVQQKVIDEMKSKLPGVEIVLHGYRPHHEALEYMTNSQMLLNCLAEIANSKILISGKLMEYIATKNPIICVGETQGDAAELFRSIPNASMFDKSDVGGISDFLLNYYAKWKSGNPYRNETVDIAKYSRFETTRTLAQIIKNI